MFSFKKIIFSWQEGSTHFTLYECVGGEIEKSDVVKYIAMKMDRKQICIEYVTKDQKGKYFS